MDEQTKYVGDAPLGVVESGQFPATIAGGNFRELNELYDQFLGEQNGLVQLCFKKIGVYGFGGMDSFADIEGNARVPKDKEYGDSIFSELNDIKADGLKNYLLVPINPEEITVEYTIDVDNKKTINFAEVPTLSGLKLRKFKIESFFPYRIDSKKQFSTEPIYTAKDYIKWLTECMEDRVVLQFKAFGDLAKPLPFMKCFIESFDTTLCANGDVEYTLSICEFLDYRQNVETRRFTANGELLVVSGGNKTRSDSRIGLGDLVYVTSGTIYSDKLKHSTISLSTITDSLFITPPLMMSTKLFDRDNLLDYGSKFGIKPITDETSSLLSTNIFSKDMLDFITELIRLTKDVDRSEIWMVTGGDYFTKYRSLRDVNNWTSITQFANMLKGASPQAWSKPVKIRSMKDNRIGWVSLEQLTRVKL